MADFLRRFFHKLQPPAQKAVIKRPSGQTPGLFEQRNEINKIDPLDHLIVNNTRHDMAER